MGQVETRGFDIEAIDEGDAIRKAKLDARIPSDARPIRTFYTNERNSGRYVQIRNEVSIISNTSRNKTLHNNAQILHLKN